MYERRRTGYRRAQVFIAITSAVAATVFLPPTAATAAPSGVRMPFPCGETWYAHTYPGHDSNGSTHNSVDWNLAGGPDADFGKPVLAGVAGTATVQPFATGGYGNYVDVTAGDWVYRYAHLSSVSVSTGDPVDINTEIGKVGNSGSTPTNPMHPHLHYEQRHDGEPQPVTFDGLSFEYTFNDPGYPYVHTDCPGGWWQGPTPDDGSAVLLSSTGSLAVRAHAEDHTGSGLERIEITWFVPGRDSTWSKSIRWLSTLTTQFEYQINIPYDLGAGNELIVSFDVYANNGVAKEAPQGMRRICRLGTLCPPVTTNPPPTPGSGQGGGTGGGQPATSCTAGSNQVVLYTDPNYQGGCVVRGIGEYTSPEAIGLPNDSISSLKVGGGAKAQLCDNAGLTSPCEFFDHDDSDLADNTINTNTVSSVRVTGGQPTTGCEPGPLQVALYDNDNYQGLCVTKDFGEYLDPGAIGLPNDSVSSIKVGDRAKVRACANDQLNTPCEEFDYSDDHLSNNSIGTNQISSVRVYSRGGIELCDGTNFGGPCKLFGVGAFNMSDYGFYDVAESVRYDPAYQGLYHLVLWSEAGLTGNPAHYDNSVADIGPSHRNHVRSIEIYKHQPPVATTTTPANGARFPGTASSVNLSATGSGGDYRIHVWNTSFNIETPWQHSDTFAVQGLTSGSYSWQVQGRNVAGEGPWSPISTFTINTAPVAYGGEVTTPAGAPHEIELQAADADGDTLALSATELPDFATFNDGHDGTGTLSLNPRADDLGDYTITLHAADQELAGTAAVHVTVTPPDQYEGQYFNNRDLSGAPALVRGDPVVDFDWGDGTPDPALPSDNFSTRWTRTANFAAGRYLFTVTGDDGVRLFLDDMLIIDGWVDHGATTYTALHDLTAGDHTIRFEYYEAGGGALAGLRYAPVDPTDYQAQYFDNRDLFGTPELVRGDPVVDFDWGGGSPDPALPSDNFSARWTRTATFTADAYVFAITGDDGVRLFLDDTLIIDGWVDQGATTYTAIRDVTAGEHTVRFEYYEAGGGALAGLRYAPLNSGDYVAQYFDNRDLWGIPAVVRGEPTIDHDWGDGSPDAALPGDNFSARWTKTDTFAAGSYLFAITGDDGVRLYLDDTLVIDGWVDQGATTYTTTRDLTAGQHTIRFEYYESGGGALAGLRYAPVDPTDYQAEYFDNRELFGTPAVVRGDAAVDFDWGGGSPDPAVPEDNFSARWTRTATFTAGNYLFTITGDDGVRLFLDDVLILDGWVDQGPTTYATTRTLTAGEHKIRFEYYEAGGGALARLSVQ